MALNLKLPIFQRERERNKKRSALKETLEYNILHVIKFQEQSLCLHFAVKGQKTVQAKNYQ